MKLRVFFCCLALLAATAVARADENQPRSAAANVPASHVRILGALFARSGSTDYVCMAYANDYTQPLTLASFKVFYSGLPGADQDVVVRAPVAPSDRMMPPLPNHPGDPATMPNCAPFTNDRGKVQLIFVFPARFEFADGTNWELKKKDASPSLSPSASPTP